MPPYWSDMSGNYFLWLHESPGDGSLFGQNKWEEFSFIRTPSLSERSNRLLSLSRTRKNFVFKLQKHPSVLRVHPPKSKTVSKFFVVFKFLVERSVSFLDSDLWSLISEIALNVLRVLDCLLLNNYCLIRLGVVYACFWYKFWVFRYTK